MSEAGSSRTISIHSPAAHALPVWAAKVTVPVATVRVAPEVPLTPPEAIFQAPAAPVPVVSVTAPVSWPVVGL